MAKRYTATDVYNLLNNYIIKHESDFKTLGEITLSIKGDGSKNLGLETRMVLAEERETKRDRREWFLTTVIIIESIALVVTNIFL